MYKKYGIDIFADVRTDANGQQKLVRFTRIYDIKRMYFGSHFIYRCIIEFWDKILTCHLSPLKQAHHNTELS